MMTVIVITSSLGTAITPDRPLSLSLCWISDAGDASPANNPNTKGDTSVQCNEPQRWLCFPGVCREVECRDGSLVCESVCVRACLFLCLCLSACV